MSFGLASYGFALGAGVLSTLSPCVLPLIPILLGTAASAHRLGPYALALGLATSFTIEGVFVAGVGASIGLDESLFRNIAAVMLILFAIVLLSPRLQEKFAVASSGISGAGNTLLQKITVDGLSGQLLLGLVLGVVWSPCVGPTLGAAVTLASQGQDLLQVAVLMMVFGIGAGMPLVLLGSLSRQSMLKLRHKLFSAGKLGKQVLGGVMLAVAVLVLSGLDKRVEAVLVNASPMWLVQLTTSL
ncbi:cytochrome c biogenesis CcdA family protein [Undibacterium sp.]|uniref:cytochrome c biogenesis CcdA family protein n=1 Tax=Undibacterium sp. TaxID=1914977 RepID=UPI002B6CDB0B|nr:cytochrome c biogenesis CcdA family protein [Undibacterium sp.]HTD03055.1 cytochrome c biogenesis CcdA family protein [Undibacterium sp.]